MGDARDTGYQALGLGGQAIDFTEYWDANGVPVTCSSFPLTVVEWAPPTVAGDAALQGTLTGDGHSTCPPTVRTQDPATGVVRNIVGGPWATVTTGWTLPRPASGTTVLENDVRIDRKASATVWRLEATMSDGAVYQLGLQSAHTTILGEEVPERAVLSAPAAVADGWTTAANPACAAQAYDGTGIECPKDYPIAEGHAYRLRLENIGTAVPYWLASVRDLDDPQATRTVVGLLQAPGAASITGVRDVEQFFGVGFRCDENPPSEATFARPGANPSSSGEYATVGSDPTAARSTCTGGGTSATTLDGVAAVHVRVGGPRARVTQAWNLSPNPSDARQNLQQEIVARSTAKDARWATAWTWAGITRDDPGGSRPFGGEFGIETNGLRYDGTRGPTAYVGMRYAESATGNATGAECRPLGQTGYDGTGSLTCKLPVTLTAGTRYRFALERGPLVAGQDPNEGQVQEWVVTFTNVTTGVVQRATFHVPNDGQDPTRHAAAISDVRSSSTSDGPAATCAEVPVSAADFVRPQANFDGRTWRASGTPGAVSTTATPPCAPGTASVVTGTPSTVRLTNGG